MNEKLYNQNEILGIMKQYNSTNRKTIKANYKRILNQFNIQPKEIMGLGYAKNNTYAWSTISSPNVPMLDQALHIACAFDFPIEEFLKEI